MMELTFKAELYPWEARSDSWVFATLPQDVSDAICDAVSLTGGFGSIKVGVQIGDTAWETSIFPSKQEQSYVLPIKQAVRKAESLDIGDNPKITIKPKAF